MVFVRSIWIVSVLGLLASCGDDLVHVTIVNCSDCGMTISFVNPDGTMIKTVTDLQADAPLEPGGRVWVGSSYSSSPSATSTSSTMLNGVQPGDHLKFGFLLAGEPSPLPDDCESRTVLSGVGTGSAISWDDPNASDVDARIISIWRAVGPMRPGFSSVEIDDKTETTVTVSLYDGVSVDVVYCATSSYNDLRETIALNH